MKESLMDIMSISAAKKAFSLTWEKVDKADGYEVSYSTYKSMKKAKTVTIEGENTENAKVDKLSSGKKYYVRVRAYTMVGTGKVYTEWSDKEAVTTK